MNLFQYLGTKKLNELILPNPYDSNGKLDVTQGPNRYLGLLGSEYKLSEKTALKVSNTTIGTLYSCVVKMVRIQPDFGTVALTDIIAGRPLYWNDTKKFTVTPLASLTAKPAGIAITNLTSANSKGDIIPIVVAGEVGALFIAEVTKAAAAINDPVVNSIAANLGGCDVLADATGWTNVQMAARIGRMAQTFAADEEGAVFKIMLDNMFRITDDGVI